jgi:hypothetical protein
MPSLQGHSRANALAALRVLERRAQDNAEAAEVLAKVRARATGQIRLDHLDAGGPLGRLTGF